MFGFCDLGCEETEIIVWKAFENARNDAEAMRTWRRGLQRERGFRLRQALEHGAKVLEVGVAFRECGRSSGNEVLGSAAQFFGGLTEQLEIMTRGAFRAAAADEFDAPILADFAAAPHQEHTDLAGAPDVRAAAGLQIGGFDFDRAQDALAGDLFSHPQSGKFVRRSLAHDHRASLEHELIPRAA